MPAWSDHTGARSAVLGSRWSAKAAALRAIQGLPLSLGDCRSGAGAVLRHFRHYVLDRNIFRVFIVALGEEPRPTAGDFDNAGWFTRDEGASLGLMH
jgi:hypothetical protein